MRNSCFIFLFLLLLSLPGKAQKVYWQQQADFVIDVTLNDTEHSLEGFEKITYTNNSPDTLQFIWFHLWPNAYKNDKTAFSEQFLMNNRTDFYFSNKEKRGYINRLDFKINGVTAKTEDHPQHIDIIKLILPKALAPGEQVLIATPFHVKLPYLFSRSGHVGQSYQVAQWYPKPAVYDDRGWHPIPYLDLGEFYSEFGNFDVRITVPKNYVVAATGELQNEEEKIWLAGRKATVVAKPATPPKKKKPLPVKKKLPQKSTKKPAPKKGSNNTKPVKPVPAKIEPSSVETKTLQFTQEHVHDFAWFADKNFVVDQDTLQLASGRTITVSSYYTSQQELWKKSLGMSKDALRFRSSVMGEYPYKTATVVQGPAGDAGGMEYPTITLLRGMKTDQELDLTIEHELGHNWLYGILASNERQYPWMDEGINTYYDNRYLQWKYNDSTLNLLGEMSGNSGMTKKLPEDPGAWLINSITSIHKDQPINLSSEEFTDVNYYLIAYLKTAQWMKMLERKTGIESFDKSMQEYYRQWQFKHPYPEDLKKILENGNAGKLDNDFKQLDQTGSLTETKGKKKIKAAAFFNLKDSDHTRYINISPSIGYNMYDGFMIGALIHNYQLPANRFQFLAAPMYATGSKTISGLARASYSWYPKRNLYRIDLGGAVSKFTADEFQPENQEKIHLGYTKLAPFLRITLKPKSALDKTLRYIQFKSYFISEETLDFRQEVLGPDTIDVVGKKNSSYYINQVKLVARNDRVLYPYNGELVVDQSADFVRAGFTGNYFFNYSNRQGGMNVRLFAGKFFYLGAKTLSKQFATDRYHLNLSGANGYEDYTYSNYFLGRNEFEGFASQQTMIRDGAFKVRTDLLSNKVGKTDRWLIASNFTTDVPKSINPLQLLPIKIPLKIFVDIGTSAEGWDKDAETSKFLYDAGFQLSFLKETVNIYIPIIYSKVYKDYFRSTLGDKWFWKTISFSIDIQNFNFKKIDRSIPF